jgi:hypothetical protein
VGMLRRAQPGEHARATGDRRLRIFGGVVVAVVLVCAAEAAAPPGADAARPVRDHWAAAGSLARREPAIEPQVCSSCSPPLLYIGGPVLSTNTSAGLTITPIFWHASGYSFPARFESIVDGYVKNIAAASGSSDNVYSVDTEYYDKANGVRTFVTYNFKAGAPIIDTSALPASGCKIDTGETACITDDQLRAELTKVLSNHGLPSDLAHFYPVFFPPKVETQDRDGTNSASGFCGYHRSYGSSTHPTVYADIPFDITSGGCDQGQAPNGLVSADGTIDTFSHELNEAISDPLTDNGAWRDDSGNEMGDMCSVYGQPLGHTNSSDPTGSEYNQVINGGKYYTQAEFSNLAFQKLGYGKGCGLSEALAEHPSAAGVGTQATTVAALFNDATPTTLPADGSSTAEISAGVNDAQGYSVSGDSVHFSVGLQSGSGTCGTVSPTDKTTNDAGHADVTYTASTSNVSCWVVAVEAEGGRSAQAVIYQGTTQKNSPTFHATFPGSVPAGSTKTFTMTATNPGSQSVYDARVDFVIFPGNSKAKNVNANQVHMTYSTAGPNGTFKTVHLTGSTGDGNAIQGYFGPEQGGTFAPHSTTTYTVHVNLAHNVPVSNAAALLGFEGYLDQIDSASGSGITLADTYESDVKVPSASSDTLRNVLIGIGAAIVLALAVLGGILVWRRHKGQPPQPPAAPAAA